ncbi:MAG: threonine--tRNA ligase [Candidatus Marsarchaeota archaeon]|nr:threonine--tRNA ligase [Candidatus Marsarchaeota archaeon]
MRVLQLDVDNISYKMVKPEASIYDSIERQEEHIKNALVLFMTIEKDDTLESAKKMFNDSLKFAEKQKVDGIVLYPFAHLSSNLEDLDKAAALYNHIKAYAKENKHNLNIISAPFGWNKQLSINIKGHPLAEQSRWYSNNNLNVQDKQKEKKEKRVDLSIVKKSDWSGLGENDHRTIAERMDLFSFQEISPGMVYWHNNGIIIYQELIAFIRKLIRKNGYIEISTPALANIALWHVSGHIDHYKEDMFILGEDNDIGIKPMNCPSTIMIYKSRRWSYRDLPLRMADFDKLYRNEISGALTGLFRVREITQDDAHIFTDEQHLESEIMNLLKLTKYLYGIFGLEYYANLSTMPDSHLGEKETWDAATSYLKSALEKNGIKYNIKDKDGAFYGPKIDIHLKDSMKREWQCGTIQLDYQLPVRFNLSYTGEDGREHTPIIIHRVLYGSLERFIGILTEHFKGKFPTWIAPIQASVISISAQSNDYAQIIYNKMIENDIRAQLDISDKTLEYKIRDAKINEVPYTIVIGQKERDGETISIRDRTGKQLHGVKINAFIEDIKKEVELKPSIAEIVEKRNVKNI